MNNRLYYKNAYLREFEARILNSNKRGPGYAISLDKTAFYPTSGGQLHDIGTIDGISVVDVWEDKDGQIWHLLESLPELNSVIGLINWPRRFDHMQQHTGQHVLSAIFLRDLAANTIGFHIGEESSTMDLDKVHISKDEIRRIEEIANRTIWENHSVNIKFINENEINGIPFRKPPQVSGVIRVIQIKDIDTSACGGTHVKYTGEIGIIKITKSERYKGGTRLNFLCGARAFLDYQNILDNVQAISTSLSIHRDYLPHAVKKMVDKEKYLRGALTKSLKQMIQYEADHLWNFALEIDGIKRIVAHWKDRPFDEIQTIANYLRKNPKSLILLAVTGKYNTRILSTHSDDLEKANAVEILKETVDILDGRGGGSPLMAHGSVPKIDHNTLIQILMKIISKPLE